VRRVADFFVHNWPLKVGAIFLATVLYSGLVLGQNVRTWTGTLPIEVIRAPEDAALLSDLPPVTQVRYRAPLDVGVVSPTSFSATVDLSRVQPQPGGPAQNVPVTVIALNSQIQVVDYQPREIPVQLDPLATKSMPVTVIVGSAPDGVSTGPPIADPSSVTVTGASSRVDVVTSVVALVSVDASGINIDREVDLVAVDSNSNQVPNVELDPERVHVSVAVARQLANVTLPVVPQVIGDPATGYRITSVTVDPNVLTVSGEASVVTQMQNAMTTPIDINGRTTDLEAMVQFALPDGVSVSGTNSVRVVVTIAEMTGTRTFQVGVEMVGQDTGNSYVSSPPSVQVVLGGPISALDAVDASQLVATADVSPLAAGSGASPVPVSFTPPPGLDLVSITPDSLIITADTLPSPSISATVEPQ
jgi:YbbR domain-containing protein